MRALKLTACSAALALLAAPAFSQDSDDDSRSGIDEITVTAQKREQSLQDVPVTITAFTGEQIKEMGITNMSQLAQYSPNVSWFFGYSEDTPELSIRGASSIFSCCANSKPAVGFYLDEVYFPSNVNNDIALFDLARTEVLRGPQGTLFGRNAVGGAYSTFPTRPNHEEWDGFAELGFGNYESKVLEWGVGGPISDTMAMRFSGQIRKQDEGLYYSRTLQDSYGKKDKQAFRLQFSWQPNENFDAYLHVGYSKDESEPQGAEHFALQPDGSDPIECTYAAEEAPPQDSTCFGPEVYIDTDGKPYHTDEGSRGGRDSSGTFVALKWNYDLSFGTLSSVTGYNKYDRRIIDQSWDSQPEAFLHVDTGGNVDVFSQELRIASDTDGNVSWIGGLYYATDDLGGNPQYNFSSANAIGVDIGNNYDQDTSNWAAFAHVDWSIGENGTLGTGIRYTDESIDFNFQGYIADPADLSPQDGFFGPTDDQSLIVLADVADAKTDNSTTDFRVSYDHTINENTMFFASISRAHKSGGYLADITLDAGVIVPYGAEKNTAYELGLKTLVADGKLLLNTAVFLNERRDQQIVVGSPDPNNPGVPHNVVQNAASSDISGFEIDATWAPTDRWRFVLGFGLMNSELVDIDEGFGSDGQRETIGDPLGLAPDSSWSLIGSYTHPLSGGGSLRFQADAAYQDQGTTSTTPEWRRRQEYTLVNASISYESGNEKLSVRAWARNLTDENAVMQVAQFGFGYGVIYRMAPQTYGITARYDFF